ncbi:ABC transporter permease subunit [Pseudoalteromonas mariniglutinosa]|uniref:ABC transporter permease subunit n=1 Tax=Pseudoalteromonas mariniglutinosa TaxID=206042 RepID=UPI0038511AD9
MNDLFKYDMLELLRDKVAKFVIIAGFIGIALAVATGSNWLSHLENNAQSTQEQHAKYRAEQRAKWVIADEMKEAEALILPVALVTSVQLPVPLLADFTIGRSSIEPTSAEVRQRTRSDNIFTRYQVENPERLWRGALDMSFYVVVIAPLLLIGVGYGVYTHDRETGRARLWLSQAGSPVRLIVIRSLNRLALVFIPILIGAIMLALLGPSGRMGDISAWLGLAGLGLLFWWSLILLINTLAIRAETAAFTLIGFWALLVFVAPMAILTTTQLINPPPSKFEAITTARAAEIQSVRIYDDDHPTLSSSTVEGRLSRLEKSIEVRKAVAEAIRPILEQQTKLEAQQESITNRLAFLSPPTIIADKLAKTARTDDETFDQYRLQAGEYVNLLSAELTKAITGNGDIAQRINGDTFDALPIYQPSLRPYSLAWSSFWFLLITSILLAISFIRYRQLSPI